MDAYAKLLEEIEGHKYEKITGTEISYRCHHSWHNAGPSENCWRASVFEFLDAQSCKSVLTFLEDGERVLVRCAKPTHDKSISHEGEATYLTSDSSGYRTITWKEL